MYGRANIRILLRALACFVWTFNVWYRRNLRIYQRSKGTNLNMDKTEVVVSGKCVICGKQLERGRLHVCKKCERRWRNFRLNLRRDIVKGLQKE